MISQSYESMNDFGSEVQKVENIDENAVQNSQNANQWNKAIDRQQSAILLRPNQTSEKESTQKAKKENMSVDISELPLQRNCKINSEDP